MALLIFRLQSCPYSHTAQICDSKPHTVINKLSIITTGTLVVHPNQEIHQYQQRWREKATHAGPTKPFLLQWRHSHLISFPTTPLSHLPMTLLEVMSQGKFCWILFKSFKAHKLNHGCQHCGIQVPKSSANK